MDKENIVSYSVSMLRIAIGWHFLYEGLVKFSNPTWTSVGYLSHANWIFSNFFHQLANSIQLIQLVDFLNMSGLVLIGFGLLLGIAIRWSAVFGITLLILYYIVNPSLIGEKFNSVSSEGSYLIVNKNIIEAFALVLVYVYPTRLQVGLHLILCHFKEVIQKSKNEKESRLDRSEVRRSFLQSMFIFPFAGVFGISYIIKKNTAKVDVYSGATTNAVPDKALTALTKDEKFSGSIAGHEVSRLILGGGCLSGWQHPRDLKYVNELALAYNSNDRVIETLKKAELLGINSVNVFVQQMPVVQNYRSSHGGKIKAFVAVSVNKDDLWSEIKQAEGFNAEFIYIQPYVSDRLIYQNEAKVLVKALEFIRSVGRPAGIGCFSYSTVETCLSLGIYPDFYIKSIHPDNYWSATPLEHRSLYDSAFQKFYPDHNRFHDNIFDIDTKKTKAIMQNVNVPWIGFKTLASGAVDSKHGFTHAFEGGVDFISVGMFDFQLERSIKTTIESMNNVKERKRKWYS